MADKDEKTTAFVDGTNDVQLGEITDNADELQRRLGNREIQLIAIGGSIGTALFVRCATIQRPSDRDILGQDGLSCILTLSGWPCERMLICD